MSRSYLILGAVAVVILLTLNIWFAPDPLQHSATSFGIEADGYKAAYDLLTELGLPVSRSFVRASQVPVTRTLWFVGPSFLDADGKAASGAVVELRKWVAMGGTAVVFGDPDSAWENLDIERETQAGGEKDVTVISGDLARKPRMIAVRGLLHFKTNAFRQPVLLDASGQQFALEIKVGAGRIVEIADSRFFANQNLGTRDASVLLLDLVRALGVPAFDELSHGLAPPASFIAAMASSRAMLPLIAGLLAALAWAAEQRSWPRRTLADAPELADPSVVSYVNSLGVLYTRARDPAAVFRAYRAGYINRLRRRASARREVSEDAILERLARDRSLSSDTRRWLIEGASPANEEQLVAAVRAIESYPGIGL